jgi:hypothetical protein
MAVEPKFVDLINAEIDAEISAEDRALLDMYLAQNPEARALRDELTVVCAELDAVESIPPPAHLKHLILSTVSQQDSTQTASGRGNWRVTMGALFGGRVMRHALSFAVGVILTYTFISSDQISRQSFDDVTGLVGTISQPQYAGEISSEDSIEFALAEIAGSVRLSRVGAIMILDFDLASQSPIEIVAGFADRDIWFNGFAQLESDGTTIAAEAGQVTLRMEGQRRYAVYLHNASNSAAIINLRFYAGGTLIHEDELRFNDTN